MNEGVDTRFEHLETKIGLFLALTVAACLGLVIYLSIARDLFTSNYFLNFTVERGTGFATGMPIKLSGFRIGRIHEISLNQDARVNIKIKLASKYQQWIRSDSVARLVKEGIVGDQIIELSAGSPGKRMLIDGDSLTFEITKSLDEHVSEIAEIISYINDPEADIKKSLHNIQIFTSELQTLPGDISDQLQKVKTDINQTLGEISTSFVLVRETLKAIEESMGQVNQTLAGVDQMVNSADQVVNGADQMVTSLNNDLPALINRLDNTLSHLEETSANLQQTSGDVAPQLPLLLEELDTTLREAQKLIGAVGEIWFIENHLPPDQDPLVEGDSHE